MNNTTQKKGFAAYKEIDALAKEAFPGQRIVTQASIFGDEYVIRPFYGKEEIIKGTTDEVRAYLKERIKKSA